MLESLAKLSNILAKMHEISFYYQPVARYVRWIGNNLFEREKVFQIIHIALPTRRATRTLKRGGFVKLGHSNKNFEVFFFNTLKTTFWIVNLIWVLSMDTIRAIFSKVRVLFLFSKKVSPSSSPSCAPANGAKYKILHIYFSYLLIRF